MPPAGALFMLGVLCMPTAGGQTPASELKAVNYTQLGELVKQHQGKVVLIDFWHNG
jgi:hypothetical protein